jgi:hypothetical protein
MLLRLEGLRGCAAAATALPQPAGGHRGDLGQSREKRWCVRCVPYIEIELEHLGFVHLRGLCAY